MTRNRWFLLSFAVPGCTIISAQEADTTVTDRFTLHAQATVINQLKPAFAAPYTGEHSLVPGREDQTSITSTLFMGTRLWRGASAYLNPEIAGGSGLSQALGIAAATNGETFRIGSPAPAIYLARLYITQLFAIGSETTFERSDYNTLAGRKPSRYIAVTIGKVSIADYFDDNRYSHDARTQFMSWALMDNGAWDYPANTRGYTPSGVIEYVSPKNEFRYAFSLEPLSANGNVMNYDVSKAGANSLEYTRRFGFSGKEGAVRILAFYNTANMGSYRESIAQKPAAPAIVETRQNGRSKYGFGISADQQLSRYMGVFFRAGWNDGKNETWAFTEIDRSLSGGFSFNGTPWHRKLDHAGIAYVVSGLSAPHREYLAAGGEGFMLGDGALHYTTEQLAECYYSFALAGERIVISGAYQLVMNPGYNRDRKGPVSVFSARVHLSI